MIQPITVVLEEEDRQVVLLALAQLSLERPGWDYMLADIALKMDNKLASGRPEMYDQFRAINGDIKPAGEAKWNPTMKATGDQAE